MTYRASLGTRGELRRIAAEAETITIDRVRPWIRKVQQCRLAPHVIVPQWTRLEHPVKPKPPPPLVSESLIVAGEFVEEILESATAKKFRRGRGRRGRPRKRADGALNPEVGSVETGEAAADKANEVAVANGESAAGAVEMVVGNGKDAQDVCERPETQESERKAPETVGTIEKDNEEPKLDQSKDEDIVKAQSETKEEISKMEIQSQVERTPGGEALEKKDVITPGTNEAVVGQNANTELKAENVTEQGKMDKDVEMTEAPPTNKETS